MDHYFLDRRYSVGKYMVVYLYPETVKEDERQFFLWNLEEMSTATVGAYPYFHWLIHFTLLSHWSMHVFL